jgi:mono/diheme cytochrome c family protein
MKSRFKSILGISIFALSGMFALNSCKSDPNSPGLEYMPDMYRSSSIEPYVDYGHIRGRDNDSLAHLQSAKTPPYGTVPFYGTDEDIIKIMLPYKHKAPLNGDKSHALWGDEQSEIGRDAAINDVNPIPYSEITFAEGKDIYEKFCQHCHGEKGDGQGKIVQNGKMTGVPNYSTNKISEGEIFYTVTYGKGIMGQHRSLLDKKERWLVTMYVKGLQNGGKYGVEEVKDTTVVEGEALDVAPADTTLNK